MKKTKSDRPQHRKHVPHVDEGINDDGSPNLKAIDDGYSEIRAALASGKLKLLSAHQIDIGADEDMVVIRRKHL